MTSALDFKARVDLFCMLSCLCDPQIHLWCNTYWLYMSDREGHGHKAVLYKSQFPPLRHSFRQRHCCIHRLINHVYTKDQALCYSLPHDMVAAQIKHWDLRNISLGCVNPLPINQICGEERTQGLPFHTPIAALPSCGTSVPASGGHCITVSEVQQEDCDKGHIQYQVVCFRLQ